MVNGAHCSEMVFVSYHLYLTNGMFPLLSLEMFDEILEQKPCEPRLANC